MKIITCEQGSPEWYACKVGIPSASNFDKLITTKGEVSKQRTKYLYQLAGETITGVSEETYQNGAMQRGTILEAEAREFYQLITGEEVLQVGFCLAEGFGASPDALVGEKGVLEIKCPIMSTHIGYLLDNVLPTEYIQQVQGELLATGRDWVDFLSYYPGIKPLIIRVNRDEKFLKALRVELEVFVMELKDLVKKIGG
uniref:Putative exonuclease n=1 Tax=viral metagenome TaxID=1070528 RepID=A0A6H2A1P6_9ZZZZ